MQPLSLPQHSLSRRLGRRRLPHTIQITSLSLPPSLPCPPSSLPLSLSLSDLPPLLAASASELPPCRSLAALLSRSLNSG
eukprot:3453654-Rhodomonas_salina.3